MVEKLTAHEPLLVNTIGHSLGALLFGILILLLLRERAGARIRGSRLSLAAASLAFLWNFASLVVLALSEAGLRAHLVVAVSSVALSLLPALLFHLCLDGRFRGFVIAGYVLGAVAAVMHSSELFLAVPRHHRLALLVTTLGFSALTVLSALGILRIRTGDRRRLSSRLLGTMSLFLFALSLVHFGAAEAMHPWPAELALHHAGVPLALIVLLQDYRFALVDAFLRLLADIVLAAGLLFLAARIAGEQIFAPGGLPGPFRQGMLLVGACLLLLFYALLRARLQRLLTRILFRRPDLERALREMRTHEASAREQLDYLDWAVRRIAGFMHAVLIETSPEDDRRLKALDLLFPAAAPDLGELREPLESRGIEVVVPLRFSEAEVRHVLLGRRRGGQPYLSEDLQALARLAAQVVEHVEHFRELELRRLVSQAELRALQSQIHPHFLFNALNALYGAIPREAASARRTVLNLADILRYFLKTDRTFIPLEEELHVVKAYLEVESLRLGERLRTELCVDPEAMRVPIPMLSIQPLVENAVKHGATRRAEGGLVRLTADVSGGRLRVRVEDNGRGFPPPGETPGKHGSGVGLENVNRRLRLCYGPDAALHIVSSPEGASVQFLAPVPKPAEARA